MLLSCHDIKEDLRDCKTEKIMLTKVEKVHDAKRELLVTGRCSGVIVWIQCETGEMSSDIPTVPINFFIPVEQLRMCCTFLLQWMRKCWRHFGWRTNIKLIQRCSVINNPVEWIYIMLVPWNFCHCSVSLSTFNLYYTDGNILIYVQIILNIKPIQSWFYIKHKKNFFNIIVVYYRYKWKW